jgi:dihydropteroate synthase
MFWQTSRFSIDLATPKVMGIVNVTPDSFSDGGSFAEPRAALAHCEQLLLDGADILDIGAESSRPGARALPLEEELGRLLPVVRHAVHLGVPISIDTYKPGVMQAVLDLGADIINDIWALRWSDGPNSSSGEALVAAHPGCGVCLMHMHRDPQSMQLSPMTGDVVPQVLLFLERATQRLSALGLEKSRMVLDPGIGFGKTVEQNFALLARQDELLALGYPLLAGWSRKSSLVAATQVLSDAKHTMSNQDRITPSVTAAVLAVQNGARVVRVHDVKETVQALKVLKAVQTAGLENK